MSSSTRFLNPAEAAKRLGVSAKALRLYEKRGLLVPARTAAGWRAYGPQEMVRSAEIVALRALGLSLTEVARALDSAPGGLEPALAAHEATLQGRIRQFADAIGKVRGLRAGLARGKQPVGTVLAPPLRPIMGDDVALDLPWPWGGERFVLGDVYPLNYIIGPLGSGKTRLARRIAETLPNTVFLGLDRLEDGGTAAQVRLDADPALKTRVEQNLASLLNNGAGASPALTALLVGLECDDAAAVVVDMVEQGLDRITQEALIAHLRRRGPGGRPLFLLTRSRSILDLTAVGGDEAIILCPANHSPPTRVDPYPGAPGYEAVATCLASPEVRARTEGLVAWRPQLSA